MYLFSDQKAQLNQTYSSADTNALVAAMMFGKGLKSSARRQDSQPSMTTQQQPKPQGRP